jgi:predicted ribosome quality control (RQC) complex YloA/Tae2 family protein
MKSLSSLEIHYLVEEMQSLVGNRIDTIYQLNDHDFIFQIYVTSQGKKQLRVLLPGLICIVSEKPATPESPPSFCLYLRKHLAQARILRVYQRPRDRIVEIHVEKFVENAKRTLIVILEFFSKGNIILADSEYHILSMLRADPKQKKGETYSSITTESPFETMNLSTWNQQLSTETLGVFLARTGGLGNTYAEELCARASVSPDQKSISEKQLAVIRREYESIFHQHSSRYVYASPDGKILDATPFKLQKYTQSSRQLLSYNEALVEYLKSAITDTQLAPLQSKKKTKYLTIIQKQEEHIQEWEREIIENQQIANALYIHYESYKNLLSSFNKARKENSIDELKKKITSASVVQDIKPQKKTLIIESEYVK